MTTSLKKYVAVTVAAATCVVGAGAWAGNALTASSACAWDNMEKSRSQIGVNQLVHRSDAALTGIVTNVSPARWNSPDGKKFCPSLFDLRGRHVFRDVTVRVASSVFDSAAVRATPGTDVTFRIFGDGTPTGHVAAENPDGSTIYENQVDGRYDVGSAVLVLLERVDNFPMADGPTAVNMVTGSWLGNWTLDLAGNRAVSVQQGRSVPFDKLLARLVAERRLGRVVANDAKTGINPLGS